MGLLPEGMRRTWRVMLGLLAALVAAGCVAQSGGEPAASRSVAAVAEGGGAAESAGGPKEETFLPSAAGYYLAGREAEANGDRAAAASFMAEALKRDSDNVDLLRETFELTLGEGRMEEAHGLAMRLVAARPDSQMASILLALEDVRADRWQAAEARMRGLPRTGVASVAAPMIEAWALAGEGKTDDALRALDQLASLRGFGVLHDFHAAFINDFAGRNSAAEADYAAALKGEPSASFRVSEAFANFYARQGRTKDALALFTHYREDNPDTVRVEETIKVLSSGDKPAPRIRGAADGLAEAMFDLGSALRQETGGRLAVQFLRLSLLMEPDLTVARLTLADGLAADQREAEALVLYRGIKPGMPLYFSARLRIAEVLREMDKLDDAVKELDGLAAEWPSRPEPLATEGDFLRSADRFKEAVKAYDASIARLRKIEPNDWSLFYARGVALERSGQWPRAESDFLEALKLSPDQPSVLNYLGYSWVDRGENIEKARGMIERAVELRPNDGYIVDSLGWVLYREGQYEGAVNHLERAVELRPEDPVINDHLGDAYWRVGRLDEARYQWRRALSLKPEPDLVTQIGLKLEQGLKPAKTGERDS